MEKSFSYEEYTWGSNINRKGFDFPRLKFDYLLQVLKPFNVKQILEVGCGKGKFIFSLAEELPTANITGIDISNKAISAATQINTNSNIQFKVADAQQITFPENYFDAIIILDVLEHVSDPEKVIHDCLRVLKPGGIIHAFIPCEAQSVYWLSEKILGFHAKERTAGHIQRFTRKVAIGLFNKKMKLIDIKYSFHLFGSIMDYILFCFLLNKNFRKRFWSENKFYSQPKKKNEFSFLLNTALTVGSFLAYFESLFLQRSSILATGIHLTAIKK